MGPEPLIAVPFLNPNDPLFYHLPPQKNSGKAFLTKGFTAALQPHDIQGSGLNLSERSCTPRTTVDRKAPNVDDHHPFFTLQGTRHAPSANPTACEQARNDLQPKTLAGPDGLGGVGGAPRSFDFRLPESTCFRVGIFDAQWGLQASGTCRYFQCGPLATCL